MVWECFRAKPMKRTSSRCRHVVDKSMWMRLGWREIIAPNLIANSLVLEDKSLLLMLNIRRF